MEWKDRHEEMLFTDNEINALNGLVDTVLNRTEPNNPFEFAFLSEQFAREAGYRIATEEVQAKKEYMEHKDGNV